VEVCAFLGQGFGEDCVQYKRVIVKERLWSRTQKALAKAIAYTKEQKGK
jgi:hypothetical protein